MARHVPTTFREKYHEVQTVIAVARTDAGRHFDYGPEALPGVRVVRTEVDGIAIALSLWSQSTDIVELCGDGAYPASAALLAIDADQARELKDRGVFVDLSQFIRSESNPGVYYALFDYVSPKTVHGVLHRLIPQIEPHDGRVLVA